MNIKEQNETKQSKARQNNEKQHCQSKTHISKMPMSNFEIIQNYKNAKHITNVKCQITNTITVQNVETGSCQKCPRCL